MLQDIGCEPGRDRYQKQAAGKRERPQGYEDPI